jgi:DNA polymerase (family X)
MTLGLNADIAGRLDEVAQILTEQGANRFRVHAYHHAADVLRNLPRSVSDIFAERGIAGLKEIPGVGESIARSIQDILLHGRLAMLERLRGETDPVAALASVPGIGKTLAWGFHEDLGIDTLEELEAAAHDGRLENYAGIGTKRLSGIRDSLAQRLRRIHKELATTEPVNEPAVSELLDVDREYRQKAVAGALKKIAPRRFNPMHEAWLSILHTSRARSVITPHCFQTLREHMNSARPVTG